MKKLLISSLIAITVLPAFAQDVVTVPDGFQGPLKSYTTVDIENLISPTPIAGQNIIITGPPGGPYTFAAAPYEDNDPTNELNATFDFDSATNTLTITDAGGSLSVDLSSLLSPSPIAGANMTITGPAGGPYTFTAVGDDATQLAAPTTAYDPANGNVGFRGDDGTAVTLNTLNLIDECGQPVQDGSRAFGQGFYDVISVIVGEGATTTNNNADADYPAPFPPTIIEDEPGIITINNPRPCGIVRGVIDQRTRLGISTPVSAEATDYTDSPTVWSTIYIGAAAPGINICQEEWSHHDDIDESFTQFNQGGFCQVGFGASLTLGRAIGFRNNNSAGKDVQKVYYKLPAVTFFGGMDY